jgi:type IV pilus assembly protein PilE
MPIEMQSRKTSGFTLIEVLITIAILSILTAIAIPAYQGYITTARQTEGWENLASLKLAQEEFFLENNSYFWGGNATALNTNSSGLWQAEPSQDGTFNFDYAVVLSGGGYHATATGKNKVDPSVVLVVDKQ